MSNFKDFINNIGKVCNFKIKELHLCLIEESKKDPEKYNRLLELISNYWQNYKECFEISSLLKDHHEEIFTFYLCKIFPFRIEKLVFENPKALNPSDFRLSIIYHFNQREIAIIEDIKKKLGIKGKIKNILRKIFYFTIASIAPIIEKVYERPYAVQFRAKSTYEKLIYKHIDEIEVICRFNLVEI